MNPSRVRALRRTSLAGWLGSAGVLVLVLALGACSGDDDPDPKRTTTTSSTTTTIIDPAELPDVDPDSVDADLDYLDGEGAALLSMVDAVERATEAGEVPDEAACDALFDELTNAGTPDELATLIRPIADEVIRSSLEATRSAAVSLVANCEAGDAEATTGPAPDDAVAQGEQATALFRQRVGQLEEER